MILAIKTGAEAPVISSIKFQANIQQFPDIYN